MTSEVISSCATTASNQRAISRLVAQVGQMLLAHGAESTLVSDIMQRIGIACGVSEVAVALSANALVVTTVKDDHCITTTRSCADRGINIQAITTSEIKVSVMIDEDETELAVRVLHTAYGLDAADNSAD